jgi:hypothetical protein
MSEHGICIDPNIPLSSDGCHIILLAKVANAETRRDYRIARQPRQTLTSNQRKEANELCQLERLSLSLRWLSASRYPRQFRPDRQQTPGLRGGVHLILRTSVRRGIKAQGGCDRAMNWIRHACFNQQY